MKTHVNAAAKNMKAEVTVPVIVLNAEWKDRKRETKNTWSERGKGQSERLVQLTYALTAERHI